MKYFIVTVALVVAIVGSALSATLNVPSIMYPTIQSGINSANPNDTVKVAPGIYHEQVFVNKGVNVQGAGAGLSIIDGAGVTLSPGSNALVEISTNDAYLSFDGFTVQNAPFINNGGITQSIAIRAVGGLASSTHVVTRCDIISATPLNPNNDYTYGICSENHTASLILMNNKVRSNLQSPHSYGMNLCGNSTNVIISGSIISGFAVGLVFDNACGIYSSNVIINFNDFSKNSVALINKTPSLIYAQKNWWGSVMGPRTGQITGQAFSTNWLLTNKIQLARSGWVLSALQNPDGGWHPTASDESVPENLAIPALGLIRAYRASGDNELLPAIQNTKSYFLSSAKNNTWSGLDGLLAVELDRVLGGNDCVTSIKNRFYSPLLVGIYTHSDGVTYNTYTFTKALTQTFDIATPNLRAYRTGQYLLSAQAVGDNTHLWEGAVKSAINQLDTTQIYAAIGLSSALQSLRTVELAYTVPMSASGNLKGQDITEMFAALASLQNSDGSFGNSSAVETAFAAISLTSGSDRTAALNAINYLKAVQLTNGCYTDDLEYGLTEASGAAAMALSYTDLLSLNIERESIFVKPGEPVTLNQTVRNITSPIDGLDSIMKFSSTYFKTGISDVSISAGGGIWDQLIYNVWNTSGDLDVSVGIRQNTIGGTVDNADVSSITLNTKLIEGVTRVQFRNTSDELVWNMLALDSDSTELPANVYDSQTIVIDGAPPVVAVYSVKQDGLSVTACSHPSVQGVVNLTVTASDLLSGLDGPPEVTVTDQQGAPMSVIYDNEDPFGHFNYFILISSSTANSTANITVTATDKSGNQAISYGSFCVDKNQISGTISFSTLSSQSYTVTRNVTFIATDIYGNVLKTWTKAVTFSNGVTTKTAVGNYTLTEVPALTNRISAKTAWHLRKRNSANLDANYQSLVNFILRGGDIDGSNTVNLLDYSILRDNWGLAGANQIGNINGDPLGAQLLDYSLLKSNWFTAGDLP